MVVRPLSDAEIENGTRYAPAPAWGLHLRWRLLSFLRFHAYFVDSHHTVELPQGALVPSTDNAIASDATPSEISVATFVFGGRLAPTWELSERLRLWLAAGVGWGRFEYPTMTITEADGAQFEVRERDGSFVEFPFSVGGSFDVIDRWLAVELELTAAPATGQSGSAHRTFQTTDADGQIRQVGGFGAIEASFTQTIGLSLIL